MTLGLCVSLGSTDCWSEEDVAQRRSTACTSSQYCFLLLVPSTAQLASPYLSFPLPLFPRVSVSLCLSFSVPLLPSASPALCLSFPASLPSRLRRRPRTAVSELCTARPPPGCAVVVASDGRALWQSPQTNLVFPDASLDLARSRHYGSRGHTPGASAASSMEMGTGTGTACASPERELGASVGAALEPPTQPHSGRSQAYRPLWTLGLGLGIAAAQVSTVRNQLSQLPQRPIQMPSARLWWPA